MDLKAMQEEWLKNNKVTVIKGRQHGRTYAAQLVEDYKNCSTCGEIKASEDFGTQKGKKTASCKKCLSAASAKSHLKRKAKDPKKYLAKKKQILDKNRSTISGKHAANMASIKCKYNVSEADLQDMLTSQQGCCSICGVDFGLLKLRGKGRSYMIDHDHSTGKVRGLLCHWCNTTLGHIELTKVDPMKFTEYLNKYQEL